MKMAKIFNFRDVFFNLTLSLFIIFTLKYGEIFWTDLQLRKSPILLCDVCTLAVIILTTTRQLFNVRNDSHNEAVSIGSAKPVSGNQIQRVAVGLFTLACSVFMFHVLCILFGGPVLEKVSSTFHLAMLMSCTSIAPCLLSMGTDFECWTRVIIYYKIEDGAEISSLYTLFCSLIGTWFGAFASVLDWDLHWQVWPVSCVLGTLMGHIIGLLLSCGHMAYNDWKINKVKTG